MTKELNRFVIIFFFFPLISLGQSKNVDCSSVRKGIFYFYPHASQTKFAIVRDDSTQKEVNMNTNDTSFWRISWKNNCMFKLKFVRKSDSISDEERDFYNSHTLSVKILIVTKNYYTFKADMDPAAIQTPLVDTLWFKAR
jgi:hypothetical protein